MINNLIQELITYGLHNGLINPADEIFVTNSLLALFELHMKNRTSTLLPDLYTLF